MLLLHVPPPCKSDWHDLILIRVCLLPFVPSWVMQGTSARHRHVPPGRCIHIARTSGSHSPNNKKPNHDWVILNKYKPKPPVQRLLHPVISPLITPSLYIVSTPHSSRAHCAFLLSLFQHHLQTSQGTEYFSPQHVCFHYVPSIRISQRYSAHCLKITSLPLSYADTKLMTLTSISDSSFSLIFLMRIWRFLN